MRWRLVAIDPSVRNMGLCALTLEDTTVKEFVHAGIYHPKGANIFWARKALATTAVFGEWLKAINIFTSDMPIVVVTELQENFMGARGTTAKDSEAIQKLYWFTGALCVALWHCTRIESIWGIKPTHWKGQLPKTIGVKRANLWLSQLGVNTTITDHNITDAILIAKYAITKASMMGHLGHTFIKFEDPMELLLDHFSHTYGEL